MATDTVKNPKNPYNGKRETPAGVLSPDIAKRHGLTKFMFTPGDRSFKRAYRGNRKVKKLFEMVKTYRTHAHGVNEPRLSEALRLSVHFLLEPISRGYAGPVSAPVVDNDDSLKSVQTPMKV